MIPLLAFRSCTRGSFESEIVKGHFFIPKVCLSVIMRDGVSGVIVQVNREREGRRNQIPSPSCTLLLMNNPLNSLVQNGPSDHSQAGRHEYARPHPSD